MTMPQSLLPMREIPERCLQCPAFNRVLLVRHAAEGGGDIAKHLEPMGLQVHVSAPGAALGAIDELDFELVLWDSHAPGAAEPDAIRELLRRCPRLPIVVLANDADAETAIELIKAGAHDCLASPFAGVDLCRAVQRALHARRRLCDALLIPGVQATQAVPARFVGRSPAMQVVFKQIGQVARRDEPVLIRGETGTGKELVARTIHRHSSRCDRPYLAINCAALSENLLESELFGHEKGAFTGAFQRRLGAFECASGGTLFLDEIGDMSLALQAKILRALQEGEIHRLGGLETIPVDVRILTATNKPMEKAIQEGTFREDLYYRLNVVTIHLPALREHAEDIQELVEYFLERYTRTGERRPALAAQALRKLQQHSWPGNVRELENTIRRALVTANGQAIMEKDITLGEAAAAACRDSDLPRCAHCHSAGPCDNSEVAADDIRAGALEEQLNVALGQWLTHQLRLGAPDDGLNIPDRIELKLLATALAATHGNQVKAARLLGISRSTLREWLARRNRAK